MQGDWRTFTQTLRARKIESVDRAGKMLLIDLDGGWTWQIHLSSTGWFMPGNDAARAIRTPDPIHRNFLHGISERNVRLRILFEDGQLWNYHDSRTWGKWWLRPPGWEPEAQGPDWLTDHRAATEALRKHQSKRPTKDVLCDQHVTAGLGNYTSCEILWRAGVHPHTRWHLICDGTRQMIAIEAHTFLAESMTRADHRHWAVFDKHGEPCPRHPNQAIWYAKDGKNGKRGSYYCPICQAEGPT